MLQTGRMRFWPALVAALLLLAACGGATAEDVVESCPDLTRELISNQLGEPTAFAVVETKEASVEGTAVVEGESLWWGCGQGIAKRGKVAIDVRDADSSSLLKDYVDLP